MKPKPKVETVSSEYLKDLEELLFLCRVLVNVERQPRTRGTVFGQIREILERLPAQREPSAVTVGQSPRHLQLEHIEKRMR